MGGTGALVIVVVTLTVKHIMLLGSYCTAVNI